MGRGTRDPNGLDLLELRAYEKNIARIANAVPVTLYSRVTVNVQIVVIKCQKCNQCQVTKATSLWGRSLRVLSKCICLCHCLFIGQVMSPQLSDQMPQGS